MVIEDPKAADRVDKLLAYCREHDIGFVTMGEKIEGSQKFVHVFVDIKVSVNNAQRKA